jgi:hypothetical protein
VVSEGMSAVVPAAPASSCPSHEALIVTTRWVGGFDHVQPAGSRPLPS